MSQYYELKRRATIDLTEYLQNDNRASWASFTSTMLLKYGFNDKLMRKLLRGVSEGKIIVNDEGELEKFEGKYYD